MGFYAGAAETIRRSRNGTQLCNYTDSTKGDPGFEFSYRHNSRKNILWFDLHVADIGVNGVNSVGVRL